MTRQRATVSEKKQWAELNPEMAAKERIRLQ